MVISPPLATSPVLPKIQESPSTQKLAPDLSSLSEKPEIKAAAVHMVFASRSSQDFITPEQVAGLEAWSGLGVLEALREFPITPEVSMSSVALNCF